MAPLNERYETIGHLNNGLRRIRTIKKMVLAAAGLLVAILIAVALVWEPAMKVDKVIEQQKTRQKTTQEAIDKGYADIDERIASTHMNEHLDTLSSIIYLRTDYAEVLSSSFSWVDEYLQTLNRDFAPKDIAIIKDALDVHLSKTTTKWNSKFIELKDAYDSQFAE